MSEPVGYHWIISLHYTGTDEYGRTGAAVSCSSGVVTIDGPSTRGDLYDQIHAHAITQLPVGSSPGPVVFFALERNDLGGAS